MRVDVLTLFPAAFQGPLDVSIIGKARAAGLLDLHVHDIREHAAGRHRSVDDYPFGGGPGMVMRVDVLARAVEHVRALAEAVPQVIYLTPQGRRLDDVLVRDLAAFDRLVLVCGRYEGVDERFVEGWVDREVSIGDFVLTGGELPAMVLIDAIARHVPGALGDEQSATDESFAAGLLEFPQYTRPADFEGREVPPVLLGGDHAAIERWRREQAITRTAARRPDLLPDGLSDRPATRHGGAKIRTVQMPGDWEPLARFWREFGPPLDRETVERKLSRDPDLFVVAASGRRIVGSAMGGWDGLQGWVHNFAVDSASAADGLAAALMHELEVRFVLKGCRTLAMAVSAARDEGVSLFLELGWQRDGSTLITRDISPHRPV